MSADGFDPKEFSREAEQEQRAHPRPNGEVKSDPYPYILLRDLAPNLERREIVKGAIPFGAFGVAYAEPGAGKTAIVVDMGLHIAAGLPYRGRRVEQQPVIYVALEGHGGIGNRIIAAARELDLTDVPFALIRVADNFRDPGTSRRIAGVARQLGGSPLVVIDTLTAALAGGSDCDPKDVGALVEAVKAGLMAEGCTVLIIHHTGKEAGRGARGWSGLLGACDFEFEISRDDDLRTLRVSKMRDGSDSQPAFCYQLGGRTLGVDAHGDPVTAVVVEHLADEEKARRGKRLTPKAHSASQILWEMIKDPSQSFPLPDGGGLRCVLLGKWEDACLLKGKVSTSPREADRAKAFRRAKEELEASGAILCDGDSGERVRPVRKNRENDESIS